MDDPSEDDFDFSLAIGFSLLSSSRLRLDFSMIGELSKDLVDGNCFCEREGNCVRSLTSETECLLFI